MNNQFEQHNSPSAEQRTTVQSGAGFQASADIIRRQLGRFHRIQLQHRIQQAIETSYAIWQHRFTKRSSALLDEGMLTSEILPSMLESAAKIELADSADLTSRLATLLRNCSSGQCGSFANFSPELANFVSLFEAAYQHRQDDSYFTGGVPSLTPVT